MKLNKLKMVTAAALLTLSAGAQAGIIDLFSTDQAFLTDNTLLDSGVESSVSTAGTDIIGLERNIYVELISSTDAANRNASIGVSSGSLSFSVDSQASGVGQVQWDGVDGSIALDETGLGGVDITDAGALNSFALETIQSDLGYEFVVEAYTDAANWTKISFDAHQVLFGTPLISYIPFAGFTNAALCGAPLAVLQAIDHDLNSITCGTGNTAPVDFTNLGALQFIIDPFGAAGTLDVSLDSIRTVPEPSVLGLMGAGLLAGGLVGRARRKKNKA